MRPDMENITPTRLETLLELALRTSTANTDQFKDDLMSELIQQRRLNLSRSVLLDAGKKIVVKQTDFKVFLYCK